MTGDASRRDQERPLTERVLARLPGRREVWIVAWGLLPHAVPLIVAWVVIPASGALEAGWAFLGDRLLGFAAFGVAVMAALWGVGRIASKLEEVAPKIEPLSSEPVVPMIHRIGSTLGPLALTAVFTVLAVVGDLQAFGALALLTVPIYVINYVPLMTLLWCYVAILVGVDRLGRRPLKLDAYPGDRTLGLEPAGALAFTAFLALTAATLPILLVAARTLTDVLLALGTFVASVALFVFALGRLHAQLTRAKEWHLERARRLYAAAYEPLRDEPTLERLEERATALRAAESLVARAEAIREWPLDEGIVGRVVAISTGVVTALFSTLVLRQLGL